MNEYQIEIDSLAVGLTKPSTKLGVPFVPFFLNIMFWMFGWMFFQALTGRAGISIIVVFVLFGFLVYAFMLIISMQDLFGLNILYQNLMNFRKNQTHREWGNTDSYAP